MRIFGEVGFCPAYNSQVVCGDGGKGFRDVGLAVAAAALYALSVSISKLFMGSIEPGILAGLLYLGAGVGMWACRCPDRRVFITGTSICAASHAARLRKLRLVHLGLRKGAAWSGCGKDQLLLCGGTFHRGGGGVGAFRRSSWPRLSCCALVDGIGKLAFSSRALKALIPIGLLR